jgi:hypothetical protein
MLARYHEKTWMHGQRVPEQATCISSSKTLCKFVLIMDIVDQTPGGQELFPMVDLDRLDLQLSNSKTREALKLRRIVDTERNPGATVETTSC